MLRVLLVAAVVAVAQGCTETPRPPSSSTDAGDTTPSDAGSPDAGWDAGEADAGMPPAPDDLSAVLEPIRADAGLPALSAAVWRGNELLALGVSGTRKFGDDTPASSGDQWHLGSDTKAMTATLVGIYADQGKVRLDETIGELFAGETIDPGYADVTLEQLLQHRGGAPGSMPADIWSQMWADGSDPSARAKAVKSLLSRPPAQAPGTYVYSNAGYMIAGAALERALGTSWEQLMVRDLFTPLGMTSCGFGAPGTASLVDQPWGHQVNSMGTVPVSPGQPQADNPPSLGPAGTVHCSLVDWGRFLALHLAGARGMAPSLISQAAITRLQTPATGGTYACGWDVVQRSWAGGTALTHSGSNTLWYATAWIAPGKNLTFAVVTNRGDTAAANAVDSAFGPLIKRYAQ